MIKQYIVDAFTNQIFKGNPAAICILDHWIPEPLMMNITRENNLSETAFAVKRKGEGETEEECANYELRWFTPGGEIDLCGHATLACAYVITEFYDVDAKTVSFHTCSGILSVVKEGTLFTLDFPAYELSQIEVTDAMTEAIGAKPEEAWMGRDLVCVFRDSDTIRGIKPNLDKVKELEGLLLHVTAPDLDEDDFHDCMTTSTMDCVSRSFGPKLDIVEDPVCGSGHCHLVPYWAKKLGKTKLVAYQASKRGGTLYCQMKEDRVLLSGRAALYAVAELQI